MRRRLIGISIAVVCLAAPAFVGAAQSPFKARTTYEGKTSKGNTCKVGGSFTAPCTMTMRPGAGGRSLVITLRAAETCDDDRIYRYDFTARFPAEAGTIKADGRYSLFSDIDAELGEGTTAASRVIYNGRFYRSGANRLRTTGTLRGTSTITFADGKTLTCRSGRVTYTLHPRNQAA